MRGLWLGLFLSFAGALSASGAETPEVEKLVQSLNADDFDARNEAAAQLETLGEAARGALEKAADSKDPQLKASAAELLGKLKQPTLLLLAFDPDGKPAVGAKASVTFWNYSGTNEQKAESVIIGEDGSGSLRIAKSGVQQGQLQWEQWQPLSLYGNNLFLNFKPGANPALFVLTRGGRVSGKILDADGKPVEGARMGLIGSAFISADEIDAAGAQRTDMWGRPCPEDASGADGTVALERVPDGIYQAFVTHEKYQTLTAGLVRVREGQTCELPPFKLSPKQLGKLEITLTGADGKPLAKAKVQPRLMPAGPKPASRSAIGNQWRMAQMAQQMQAPVDTDENGKLVMENVKAGAYRVRVQSMGNGNGGGGGAGLFGFMGRGKGSQKIDAPPEFISAEFTLAGGQTQELALKPAPGTTLSGKVLSTQGQPLKNATVMLKSEQAALENAGNPFNVLGHFGDEYGQTAAWRCETGADGAYSFKNVPAGRYIVEIMTRNGISAVIYGTEAVLDKPAVAVDALLSAETKGVTIGAIKGQVLSAGGGPLAQPQVSAATEHGSWGIGVGADGKFNFEVYKNEMQPVQRLTVQAGGIRLQVIDLSTPGLDIGNLVVRLEKRGYGKLRVVAVDDAGAPLAGVQILPTGTPQYAYASVAQTIKKTNANGEVVLTGLADGKRHIGLALDGYYLDADPEVAITPDAETVLKATLHRGLSIAGKVSMPEGAPPKSVVVELLPMENNMGQVTAQLAGGDGGFVFRGLPPGEYALSAEAPGLSNGVTRQVTLKAGQTDLKPVSLALRKPAGIAFDLGAARAGFTVQLAVKDSRHDVNRLARNDSKHTMQHSKMVDQAGRVEFSGVEPGEYDVTLSVACEAQASLIFPAGNQYYGNQAGESQASLIFPAIKIDAQRSLAEVALMPAQPLAVPVATARLSADIEVKNRDEKATQGATHAVQFVLSSSNAEATLHRANENNGTLAQRTVIGSPPPGLEVAQSGVSTIFDLPAGTYKLSARCHWYSQNPNGQKAFPPVVTELATIEVKPGEHVKTGHIVYALPEAPAELRNAPKMNELEVGNYNDQSADKIESFNP